MSRVVDMRGDPRLWDEFVAEVEALAVQLPDGRRRVAQFYAGLEWAQGGEDYASLQPAPQDGIAVMQLVPGPKARAFLADLRVAVRDRGRA